MDVDKMSEDELDDFIINNMSEKELDEVIASTPKDGFGTRLLKSSLESLPTAGGLFGGAAGLMTAGPGGAIVGAGGGAALGKSLENLGERYLLGEEKTRPEIYLEPVKEAALGMAGEGAGQLVAKGLSKGAGVLKDTLPELKPNVSEIVEASNVVGVKPSQGMIYKDPSVGMLESSIEQSPTIAGQILRKEKEPFKRGMQQTAEEVFKDVSTAQPSEVGEAVKKGIRESIEKRLEPLAKTYEDIRGSSEFIELNPTSLKRVASNIRSLVPFEIGDDFATVNRIADQIENGAVKTANDLKTIRGIIGNEINKDPQNRVLSQVYGKLSGLEQNTMMREAIKQARNTKEGQEIGKRLVNDLKDANKGYKAIFDDLSTVGKGSGVQSNKIDSIEGFLNRLESIPDEAIPDKMFKVNNRKYLLDLKKNFPDQFESLKNAKVKQIYDKSVVKNDISMAKMIKELNSIEPETRTLIFGPDANRKLSALSTLAKNFPDKVGPSGTAQGIEYMNYFGLGQYMDEFRRAAQLALLKTTDPKTGLKARSAGILDMAQDPASFAARAGVQSSPILDSLVNKPSGVMYDGIPEEQTVQVIDPMNIQFHEQEINKIQKPSEKAKRLNLLRKHGRVVIGQ